MTLGRSIQIYNGNLFQLHTFWVQLLSYVKALLGMERIPQRRVPRVAYSITPILLTDIIMSQKVLSTLINSF